MVLVFLMIHKTHNFHMATVTLLEKNGAYRSCLYSTRIGGGLKNEVQTLGVSSTISISYLSPQSNATLPNVNIEVNENVQFLPRC